MYVPHIAFFLLMECVMVWRKEHCLPGTPLLNSRVWFHELSGLSRMLFLSLGFVVLLARNVKIFKIAICFVTARFPILGVYSRFFACIIYLYAYFGA